MGGPRGVGGCLASLSVSVSWALTHQWFCLSSVVLNSTKKVASGALSTTAPYLPCASPEQSLGLTAECENGAELPKPPPGPEATLKGGITLLCSEKLGVCQGQHEVGTYLLRDTQPDGCAESMALETSDRGSVSLEAYRCR